MIVLFEKFNNKPDVNSLNPEFWKMVRLANWKGAIKIFKSNTSMNSYSQAKKDEYWEQMQGRLYMKYEYDKIKEFEKEYHRIYIQLYDYFNSTWLDKKYYSIMPSDDGYSDLLSSIIGKGKTFTKSCIDNIDNFIKMAKDDDYMENFVYLLQIDFNEYAEIKSKFDPLYGDMRKYNI
jgi:hypothetical protein